MGEKGGDASRREIPEGELDQQIDEVLKTLGFASDTGIPVGVPDPSVQFGVGEPGPNTLALSGRFKGKAISGTLAHPQNLADAAQSD